MKAIYDNLKNRKIDVNLYLGNEIYFSENMIELLEANKASTINDTSYVLFELPMNIEPISFFDVVLKMLQNNLIPVLAHPERYSFVQEDPNLIYDLIERGVLMQANYGSILGIYGKKAEIIVEKLLKNNLIHFLGTDVHRQKTIYQKVPEALERIRAIVGEERLEEMTTLNPRLAIQNKKIEIREISEVEFDFKEKIKLKFCK